MTATFTKRYHDPGRAAAARAHRDWLAALDTDVTIPELRSATPHQLEFEHLGDRLPGPDDLAHLARSLGVLHAAAYRQQLHTASLDAPATTPRGIVIADFTTPRRTALASLPIPTAGLAAAFYKDAAIHNFLITDDGPAVVDFDDLTLAPFGYDLAKLIVSAAMTHGRLDPDGVLHALDIYNAHSAAGEDTACPLPRLRLYAEFHDLCTQRYLGRHGYRHAWPDVRPWPAPDRAEYG